MKQQSELAAGSTQELSREQAVLQAQQSLGKEPPKSKLLLPVNTVEKYGIRPMLSKPKPPLKSSSLKQERTPLISRI